MLSAVYPGAGQFMQRRRLVAAAYATSVTVFVVTLGFSVLGPLFHNLKAVLNSDFMNGAEEPLEQISIPAVVISLSLVFVIWVLNLVDVSRAGRRARAVPPPL